MVGENKAEEEYTPEEQRAYEQSQKMFFDTFKHLTTLSTGAILILATFIKDIVQSPEWTSLIIVAFVSLLVSTAFSVGVMLMFAYAMHSNGELSRKIGIFSGWCFLISIATFIAGLGTIAVFTIKNL